MNFIHFKMYSRILRNIFNASTKLSKQKINKSTKLIFPTSLTVPKLLACTSQCSVQNYSTNKESLDKDLSNEDLLKEQSNNEEDDSDKPHDDNDYSKCDPKNPQKYFKDKEKAKLEALLKDNPEMQRLKNIIELELIVLQQDGECVPSKVECNEWVEILSFKSKGQRRKFYKFLFINEKIAEKVKKKKEENRIDLERVREERKHVVPSDEMMYGFAHNFMLRRISNTYINSYQHWNSLKAIMFGNKLVFDCSYDAYMSSMEAKSCAKQINESYAINRMHDFPFEIFLVNANPSSIVMETLHKQIPTLYENDFPFTVTEKSYLELFDRAKLCYLSSNAPSVLEEYDHETIYIIGGFVDKGSKQPVSFGKAKREGIRMAKLPLDKYLKFGTSGGRDLTLNQMCGIMLDSQCKSWPEALRHVPTRKLYESSIKNLEAKVRRHMTYEENNRNTFEERNINMYEVRNRNTYENRNRNTYEDRNRNTYEERNRNTYEERNRNTYEERNRNRRFDSNSSIENSSKPVFSSEAVADYSHAARAKLREKWNK